MAPVRARYAGLSDRGGEGMTCSAVLQVFFDREHDTSRPEDWYKERELGAPFRNFGHEKFTELHGELLWQPADGAGPVYSWALDYVSCTDERWTVFGPYLNKETARQVFERIRNRIPYLVLGFRVINEHCALSVLGGGCESWVTSEDGQIKHFVPKLPRTVWTDG